MPRHHTDPGRDGGEGVIAPHGDPCLVIILIRAEMGEGEGVIAPHGDPCLGIILIRAEMGGRG